MGIDHRIHGLPKLGKSQIFLPVSGVPVPRLLPPCSCAAARDRTSSSYALESMQAGGTLGLSRVRVASELGTVLRHLLEFSLKPRIGDPDRVMVKRATTRNNSRSVQTSTRQPTSPNHPCLSSLPNSSNPNAHWLAHDATPFSPQPTLQLSLKED